VSSVTFLETDKVEIVICDNNSDDNTEVIVGSYLKQHNNKIKYIKHAVDIHPHLNFEYALLAGTGTIRKLHNSYFSFAPSSIDILVDIVEKFSIKKPIIFLANGAKNIIKEDIFLCNGVDEFVKNVSFWSTWIGGFFVWEDDLIKIGDFNREIDTLLSHTDFLLRAIDFKRLTVVVNKKIMQSNRTWPRGGYNVAQVFGENYLGIIKRYISEDKLTLQTYQNEKKKVLLEHILPNYFSSFHDFRGFNILKHLDEYESDEYFYKAMISGLRHYGGKS
jgi:glycosyltransferase involved in cell wall biosynthesis